MTNGKFIIVKEQDKGMKRKKRTGRKEIKWWQILILTSIILLIAIFLILLCSCGMFLFGFYYVINLFASNPQNHQMYEVENINGETTLDNGESILFYGSGKKILGYSLADNEEIVILEEEMRIWDFDIYGDWVFYSIRQAPETEAAQEIWEYNRVTEEKQMLLGDAECTYIAAYNDCLLYDNYGVDYICAIGDDLKSESVELLALFEEDEPVGEQFTVFQGILVGRKYDSNSDAYQITCVRGAEKGERILDHDICMRVLVDGELFKLDSSTYGWLRTLQGLVGSYIIDGFQESQVTVEDGKVIGLTRALYREIKNQSAIEFDFLFEVDPRTTNFRILYRQEKGMPRIIGYKEGMVYLMGEDYKLYKEPIDGGERVELFSLPQEEVMHFSWYGNYLIVRGQGKKIIGAYLVE